MNSRNLLSLLLVALTTLYFQGVLAAESPVCRNGMLYPAESIYTYSYCVNGELIDGKCPEGSYFDAIFLMCRHGQPPAGSNDAELTNGKCQRWGLAADLTDCNRFYHCNNKGATVERLSCDQGLIFDESKFTCVVGIC
ncbi:peritrophin-44 [Drosophila montana]|uniref:peritrophin-44 n=1 Tax=Drosophila montana TaxID=40370 RepID=UPI00313C196D